MKLLKQKIKSTKLKIENSTKQLTLLETKNVNSNPQMFARANEIKRSIEQLELILTGLTKQLSEQESSAVNSTNTFDNLFDWD